MHNSYNLQSRTKSSNSLTTDLQRYIAHTLCMKSSVKDHVLDR